MFQRYTQQEKIRALRSSQPDPEFLLREKNIAQQQQNPDPFSYRDENEYTFIRIRFLQHIHVRLLAAAGISARQHQPIA